MVAHLVGGGVQAFGVGVPLVLVERFPDLFLGVLVEFVNPIDCDAHLLFGGRRHLDVKGRVEALVEVEW